MPKARKYGDKAVIEPARVIQERKKIGLHPSCPELTENLCTAFERKGIHYSKGTTWTTDAPYRETIEELRQYCSEGVATVEMEASALFAVGAYRGVSVSSIFVISDILSEEDWNQGYHSEEKLESLKKTFEVALEAIAINSR